MATSVESSTTVLRADKFGRDLPNLGKTKYDVRQKILLETLRAFEERASGSSRGYREIAESNLSRWADDRARRSPASSASDPPRKGCEVVVLPSDWGVVASGLIEERGRMFAVLNMANAHVPGGGYTEGCVAQEENMFRRTDCHFSIDRNDEETVRRRSANGFDGDVEYTPSMTRLLSGAEGRVYLDAASPRVCIRGPEDRTRDDLGYDFLPEDRIFPFYELRAAAVDLRGGGRYDDDEMRKRIAAQLDTLTAAGVRHAVLSAFGCGAFCNPARDVAGVYREEIEKRSADFDVLAFAIFHAGYGPDNFTPFRDAFRDFGRFSGDDSGLVKYAESGFSTPEKKK